MINHLYKGMLAGLFCAALTGTPAAAQNAEVRHYQPTIDITQDPGCGRTLRTPAERIAHNRKLAELYFLNFQESKTRGRNYGWWSHGCVAPGSSVLLGATEPLAEPHVRPPSGNGGMQSDGAWSGEQRGYYATFDDFGPERNTLVVIPFEQGAYFRMMYGGRSKDDGKRYTIWETNLILVNDQGRITHFEMWNDSIGFDNLTKKIFGHSILDLGLDGYRRAYEAFPATNPR